MPDISTCPIFPINNMGKDHYNKQFNLASNPVDFKKTCTDELNHSRNALSDFTWFIIN